jgi:protein-S-isoprenylcysteine O-methyltransferase Ste14
MKGSFRWNWLWVASQMALLATLLFSPAGTLLMFLAPLQLVGKVLQGIGLALVAMSALNLGRSLTPLPAPKVAAELKTDGLYHFVRHPIYSGAMLWGIGFASSSGGLWHLLLAVLLCLFFNAKARYEETLLMRKFPNYAAYAHRTPRFLPAIKMR